MKTYTLKTTEKNENKVPIDGLPFGTIVEWHSKPYVVTAHENKQYPKRLTCLQELDLCQQIYNATDTVRVLGTLAPMTLADFK